MVYTCLEIMLRPCVDSKIAGISVRVGAPNYEQLRYRLNYIIGSAVIAVYWW